MRRTIFHTPLVTPVLRMGFKVCVWLRGWRRSGPLPDLDKCVLVIAPHTSNWDFPIGVAFALDFKMKPTWMGKNALFKGGLGPFSRWFGGVPVIRSKSLNQVDTAAAWFAQTDYLWLTITPEGTRSKVTKWRSGFYHIARAANVPIALAYIDYNRRLCGVDKVIIPTGDYEADLKVIHEFYNGIGAKKHDQATLPNETG